MSDCFDVDFKLLPPRLQMQLWVLALDADTGRVNLAFRDQAFLTSIQYNYGGNIEASLAVRRFTAKVGVNPANGDLDLGLAFKGFRFGTTASFTRSAYGVQLGYGASLLPFPSEMADIFNSAGHGLTSMAADIGAAPNNPLAWYQMHSDDAKVIGKAISLGQQIAKRKASQDPFGVGLRLNFDPQSGLTVYGVAALSF